MPMQMSIKMEMEMVVAQPQNLVEVLSDHPREAHSACVVLIHLL
jgi:hypothetical protein